MKTVGKLVDATVILGSVAVGYGAVIGIMAGVKSKNTMGVLLGSLTLAIAVYASKEAISKIND